jgi:broad specificity phosphatase PhoE
LLWLQKEDKTLNTRVILVRHGESTFNAERRVQGHCNQSALTERGQEDARRVGAALANIPFQAAYCSPLQRAQQTMAQIVAAQPQSLTVQLSDQLKEINLAEWEGMRFQDVETQFPDGYAIWRDRPQDLEMTRSTEQGEERYYPVRSLFEQARQFWQDILPHHLGETLLVVAHSGINRALIGTALGMDVHHYRCLDQANCGINVLNFPAGWGEPAQLESLNLTAQLGQKVPNPRAGQGGIRLLLVRHGETQWNREKRFQGQIDIPLNETGYQQAAAVAQYLSDVPIHRAITSPLLRPKQTAEAILAQHPEVELELWDGLKEISHGLWEGKLEAEIEAEYPGDLKQWQRSPETVQMPEGENLQQVWERSAATWDEIVRSTAEVKDLPEGAVTTVLVVAHDAVNKAILCHIMGWGPEYFWRFKQGNGAVSVIDYPQGIEGIAILRASNITTGESILDQTAAGAL